MAIRETIDRYADALRTRDFTAADGLLAESLTLHVFGRHPLAGVHAGRNAISTFGAEFRARTGVSMEMREITDVLVGADRAALVIRERATRGQDAFEFDRVVVYRIEDDRIVEMWVYDSDVAGFEEFAWP